MMPGSRRRYRIPAPPCSPNSAETGRTGALHIGGSPGGALYLVAGRITYAESPACPGIGERLVASGRLPAAAWRRAYADGAADRRVGRLLVRAGRSGRNELACRVVAAICDATHALLQSDCDAPVRFVPGEQHGSASSRRSSWALSATRRPAASEPCRRHGAAPIPARSAVVRVNSS